MGSAGACSVINEDMQNLAQGEENISNSISGHKANLSNPSQSLLFPSHAFSIIAFHQLLTPPLRRQPHN